MNYTKMYRLRLYPLLIIAIAMSAHQATYFVKSQPIILDPASMATGQMLAMPMLSPMIYGHQALDPYSSMQVPQFLMAASPFGGMMPAHMMPTAYDAAGRRSAGGRNIVVPPSSNKVANQQQRESPESDESKAMEDLPVNFIDDPPSTFTERLSESFSALGEGVRNHFKSISENFSDTVDDIKDAWRSSNASNKASSVELA